MKKYWYYSLIIVLFFVCIKFLINRSNKTVASIETVTTQTFRPVNGDRLFDLVQRWRYEKNYNPYINSNLLCDIAKRRLLEIKNDFSHDGFKDEISSCGDKFCNLGENLATGWVLNEENILDLWLNSEPHRKSLEKNFTHACLESDGVNTVLIFGKF